MPKARKEQISLSNTPYYHCISRCVRRAFLCGSDPLPGKDYQHRKQWMVERLEPGSGHPHNSSLPADIPVCQKEFTTGRCRSGNVSRSGSSRTQISGLRPGSKCDSGTANNPYLG